jgi:hypothetical protein
MSRISKISLLILALGMIFGLLTGGFSGMLAGLIISGALAFAYYCLANTFKANSISEGLDPFNDIPTQTRLDRSQLPKGAYVPHNDIMM